MCNGRIIKGRGKLGKVKVIEVMNKRRKSENRTRLAM